MSLQPYLECAEIVGTHGVRGAVRLANYCDTPYVLAGLKTLYRKEGGSFRPLRVVRAAVQKNMVLATFEGIDDLDKAIPLKGTVLYAARADLPLKKGDFFVADLMDLPVKDEATGEVYGVLHDVLSPAGQSIYEIEGPDGKTFLVPAVKEFIRRVVTDGDGAGIYVHLIEGMRE